MILCRITKDITWQKVVRIHDSYCEWYEKNETIAGLIWQIQCAARMYILQDCVTFLQINQCRSNDNQYMIF